MGKFIDLTGKIFDKWEVIERQEKDNDNKYLWLCRCECGELRKVSGKSLREKRSRSCGCYDYKNSQDKHFMRNLPEYRVWKGMRTRCTNPKQRAYQYYGAIGVTICERWDDFSAFYEDMGSRPSDAHSIDRIDPYGNYEPSNCRWATAREQNLNKRKKVKDNG